MAPDEWTETEVEDLKAAINDGLSVEEAAEVLDRAERIDRTTYRAHTDILPETYRRMNFCSIILGSKWPE